MKKSILVFIIIAFYSIEVNAQKQYLPSSVYEWNKIPVEKTQTGEKRQFLNGPTKTLNNFDIYANTLNPGKAPHQNLIHQDMEELILVQKGKLELTINEKKQVIGPGSIALVAAGDEFGVYNAGATPVSYFVIRWISGIPLDFERSKQNGGSVAIDYKNMEFKENQKGGRRHVMRRPTATLRELEMHITTLKEDEKSHDPHVHVDEEIIVVLSGEVEEMINGTPYRLGPGSVIFLSSMDPHGIRNVGKGQCEYYAIRWLSTTE